MFQVMRLKKFKRSACYGVGLERNRAEGRNFAKSDIDNGRSADNVNMVFSTNFDKSVSDIIKAAGVKERPDSVVMVGALFTASADYFDLNPAYVPLTDEQRLAINAGTMEDFRQPEQKQKYLNNEKAQSYFDDCLDFLVAEFCQGDKTRVFDARIDWDETTPHLQAYFVPLYERENKKGELKIHLSAKDIFGNRSDLRQHHDRFFEAVGKSRGLERGELVDWDADPKDRKKHEETHIHKRKEQAAVIDAQTATIAKNEQVIAEQNKAIVEATEGRQTAIKQQAEQEQRLTILSAQVASKEQRLNDGLEKLIKALPVRDILGRPKTDGDLITVHKNLYNAFKEFRDEYKQQFEEMQHYEFASRKSLKGLEHMEKNTTDLIEQRARELADEYLANQRYVLDNLVKQAQEQLTQAKQYRDREADLIRGLAERMAADNMAIVDVLRSRYPNIAQNIMEELNQQCNVLDFDEIEIKR